ncbi:MAG TPA: hypothetical protein VHC96_05285 [Puia sp.]|nr:hypothetical protein [Puia sp.]
MPNSQVFAVNSLAPYILTCLIKRPARLIYLSSGLHRQAGGGLDDLEWKKKRHRFGSPSARTPAPS